MSLRLTSALFNHQEPIPMMCTCEGADQSPPLTWDGVPSGTRSFALIVDDPDAPDPAAPQMTYVHWVLFNIPADTLTLPAGLSVLPQGAREGMNDFGRTSYGGPCPPIGVHRYFHKLYALDCVLDLPCAPDKTTLVAAMQGHILDQAVLVGTYIKQCR